MLFIVGDFFVQVLEGQTDVVQTFYEKILKDPRHSEAAILMKGELDKRNFQQWSMGF